MSEVLHIDPYVGKLVLRQYRVLYKNKKIAKTHYNGADRQWILNRVKTVY